LRKILIVDSDEQITAVLGLKLRKENFEVKTISSSVNAVDMVKDFKPDLIISEMVLPEVSGVNFLKRVKMNPDTMKTPFIFLSNSRNVEDKILAVEMGAEAFFMKPIFIKFL
jgi:two-component system, OmpR family, alkaline phosphatase synthesis response regulator PhoP